MKKINTLSRVLLVEPCQSSAESIMACLDGHGFGCYCVDSFGQAVNHTFDNKYDIVLISYNIIQGNSQQAIRQLKANAPDSAVIVLGDNSTDGLAEELNQATIDGYLINDDNFSQSFAHTAQIIIDNLYQVKNKTKEKFEYKADINLHQIFNAAPPLSVIDKNFHIIFANPSFCRHFNVNQEDLKQMKCWQVHKTLNCHTSQCPLQKTLAGSYPHKYETTMECANNISKHVILNASPYRDAKNKIIGIVTSITDIHERKVVEKKLLQYQEQLRLMASDLAEAEERQRKKIAEDLHDSIGQNLALAQMKLEMLDAQGNGQYNSEFKEISGIIQQTIKDTHTLIFEISPPVLYKLGLAAALQWLCENIQEKHNISCHCSGDDSSYRINENIRTILFRAARELMINCVKHSDAQNIWVNLIFDQKHLILTVQDNGLGFKTTSALKKDNGGFGLFNISERISSAGGALTIGTTKDKKTEVKLILPINMLD